MKCTLGISLAACFLLGGSGAIIAQDESQDSVEQIEKMAEELESSAAQMEAQVEAWAEEHSAEIEKWADQYSGQWEEWAERFEEKMERWAESQEQVWEKWAEDYSSKWEELGSQLESGDFDSEEMGQLIERNLAMLGEMPLEEMVEGIVNGSLSELKSAPWESLNGLTDLVQGSLEDSLKGIEEITEKGLMDHAQLQKTSDEITSALDKIKQGLETKLKKLDSDGDKHLKQLQYLIENSDLSDAQRAEIQAASKAIKEATSERAAAMKKQAKAAYEQAAAMEKEAEAAGKNAKSTGDYKRAMKEQALALEAQRKLDLKNKKRDESVIHEAEEAREAVKAKESDIDSLRKEILKLRKEVEQLKKEKDKALGETLG